MKSVLAYPGNMGHAQHAARALLEAGALNAYVTTYTHRRDGWADRLLQNLPSVAANRFARQLARRGIQEVPPELIHAYPMWELLRTLAQKAGVSAPMVDRVWDVSSRRFDKLVARKYVPTAEAVHCFEYTACAAFERAKELGVARILYLASLENVQYDEIQKREKSKWNELLSEDDAYFDAKFEVRQQRRKREIDLADVIIANSSLTAQTHIAGGADPSKVFVVPLGAPPPVAEVRYRDSECTGPLNIIFAGPFSLRKGAHYLLQAWRKLNPGRAAVLNVYGKLELPERLISGGLDGIVFHGSVPQHDLFDAFESADAFVFPTLSDGFGMVIAEAFSRGLPVITTSQAGASDLVTSENGLIVPAADVDALSNALQWCLDNRQRLREMRAPALEAAKRRQWSDFRRDLIADLDQGLRVRGYDPKFRRAPL